MVKLYQKLTLVTAILGLIIPLLGVIAYVFINSLIGIPILALFLGGVVLIAILIIAINVAAVVVAFYLPNTRIAGIILTSCGVLLLLTVQLWGLPGLVLYIITGIMALREKPTYLLRRYIVKCLTCGQELKKFNSDFAKNHLVDNPAHLEYRIKVEVNANEDSKRKFSNSKENI